MARPRIDRTVLPIRRPPFTGVARRTLDGSTPDWHQFDRVRPPAGAPNVLLVLIDDAGFGNPATFGGPVHTPTLTRLADDGLRYNRFHVTALCSPTRAALMTGRNHHTVGYGSISETASGFPGYTTRIPRDCTPFPRVLQENGYATACIGKWHLTPDDQQGPTGPFDRWPSGLGFDYFWGFLGGEASQYHPLLAENDRIIGVPQDGDGRDGERYYLPDDMADRTIDWLHGVRADGPDTPWFVYFTTGCSHAPHQVPEEWVARYRGAFDQGWDVLREETFARQLALGVVPPGTRLTPRPPELPAWDDLDDTRKRLYARQMEVYAAFQENADWNVGRVIDAIDAMGELDNTLVLYVFGDNGASLEGTVTGTFNELAVLNGLPLTEPQQLQLLLAHGGIEAWGGPQLHPHYAAAWAWAGNTPFQWGKQVASHLGGTRNPLVVHWPRRIATGGGLRSQYTHVIDVAPTILEAVGLPHPTTVDGIEQQPVHGTSFADSFDTADAPEHRTQQYYEVVGNRGMYRDGWLLAQRMPRIPWELDPTSMARFAPGVWDPDTDPVELYHLPDDFSQAVDLAEAHPDKVRELRELFWQEAERYQVLPLLGGVSALYGMAPPPPAQPTVTFHGRVRNISAGGIPPIHNHSYTISADLVVPRGGGEGVIVAAGDHLGGFTLFVDHGRLVHTYSLLGVQTYTQQASRRLPRGEVNVLLVFAADAAEPATGGEVTLLVDGRPVGHGRIEHTVPASFGTGGMDIGGDHGQVVDRRYADRAPFRFTGQIRRVVFDVQPHLRPEEERALHDVMTGAHVARGLGA